LSFDADVKGSSFESSVEQTTAQNNDINLIPLFKFTITIADSTMLARQELYHAQRLEDFIAKIGDDRLHLSRDGSNIQPDSLGTLDRQIAEQLHRGENWILLFKRGVKQSLIKQYTNAVGTLTFAITANPSNPFLYINRSTTRAEMIDFISSIDNSYHSVNIDSDPSKRLHTTVKRTYSYDEAIDDMNEAIRLYPEFAEAYYNRANLMAISGKLPEAYDDYTRAIELDGNLGEAYYNRGLVQIFMKDTRKGCMDLSKAGELGIERAYDVLREFHIAAH
jgi:tetratricopeptide (TPR) repeat protein